MDSARCPNCGEPAHGITPCRPSAFYDVTIRIDSGVYDKPGQADRIRAQIEYTLARVKIRVVKIHARFVPESER